MPTTLQPLYRPPPGNRPTWECEPQAVPVPDLNRSDTFFYIYCTYHQSPMADCWETAAKRQ